MDSDGNMITGEIEKIIKTAIEKQARLGKCAVTNNEGGVDVSKEVAKEEIKEVEKTVDNAEVAPTEEAPVEGATAEKTEDVVSNEEGPAEVDLEKMFGEFAAQVQKSLVDTQTQTAELVKSVQASFDEKSAELTSKISDLNEKVGALEGRIGETKKSVDALESDTAFRKSSDLGREEGNLNKSEWGGVFFSADSLNN